MQRTAILIALVMLTVVANSAYATNVTSACVISNSSEACSLEKQISLAEEDMAKMISDGFKVTRYNDTLTVAKNEFDTKLYLQITTNKTQDFSVVKDKLNELANIKTLAYRARDELKTLEATINETGGDLSEVMPYFYRAKSEFLSERYEYALNAIDATYQALSEQQSMQTKLRLFYEATTRTLANFVSTYWKEIIVSIIVLAIVALISWHRISIYLLNKKLEHLYLRRTTLKKLIAKTQKEFFEKGTIDETTYHIRLNKYGEIIRDINRQIPLVKEELESLSHGFIKIRRRGEKNEQKE